MPFILYVDAVVVLGGVARGWADDYSDIDLVVYWREPPTETERRTVIGAVGGTVGQFDDTFASEPDPTLRYWWEDYYLAGDQRTGLKIDVGHHLRWDMDAIIKAVTQQHEMHPLKHEILYSIKRVQVLYGELLIQRWKTEAGRCPETLACQIVEDCLRLPPLWGAEASVVRDDWLSYTRIIAQISERLLRALVALNRGYYPGSKRQQHLLDELNIKPQDFNQRLNLLLRGEPQQAVRLIADLHDEILTLASEHMPQADLSGVREWFRYRRKRWENPPAGML